MGQGEPGIGGRERRRLPARRRRGFAVLAGVLGLLVALLLGELGIRLAGRCSPAVGRRVLREADSARSGHVYLHDAYLGWRNIPGFEGASFGQPLHINALGLRGPEVSRRKPPGTRRVLVLGDSFTWGYGVGDNDTFSAQLQGRLTGRPAPTQVLNAAVSGWGTDQQYLYLRSEGMALDPDLVLVAFFLLNDPMECEGNEQHGMAKPRFTGQRPEPLTLDGVPVPLLLRGEAGPMALQLADGCEGSALCRHLAWRTLDRPTWRRLFSGLGLVQQRPFVRRELGAEPMDLVLSILEAANRLVHRHGARLMVMKFGAFLQPAGENPGQDFVLRDRTDRLVTGLARLSPGVPFLDLDAEFSRWGLTAASLTGPVDAWHFNPGGHRQAGRILAEFLRSQGF